MQKNQSELHDRHARVQELCAQLLQLVSLSREQRRRLDDLLSELDTLTEQISQRPLVKRAGTR